MEDGKLFEFMQKFEGRLSRIEAQLESLPEVIKAAVTEHAIACGGKSQWRPDSVIKLAALILGSGGLGVGIKEIIMHLAG